MSKHSGNITEEQMLDALKRSGYLLEHRVEQFFSCEGYHISNSNYFVDEQTKKLREIDLIAETADVSLASKDREVTGTFTYKFICECENNPQPVVFILSETKFPDRGQGLIDISIPSPIVPEDQTPAEQYKWGDTFFSSSDVFELHHFFQRQMATQYCSFAMKEKNKPDGEWIAKHSDEQHDTLTNLLKGATYVSGKDAAYIDEMPIRFYGKYQIFLYYPVLILQNQLFSAKITKEGTELNECDHVVYWANHKIGDSEHLFGIDVIRESYLPKYLELIHKEIENMHFAILNNPYLQTAIEKWTERKIESKEIESQHI